MDKNGPGRFGGSRETVRKREQRKRKISRERQKHEPMTNNNQSEMRPVRPVKAPVTGLRPVLQRTESDAEHRMEMMAYELTMIATQLRKSMNTYGVGFDKSHAIIQDTFRADKIIKGMLKDNYERYRYEKKEN